VLCELVIADRVVCDELVVHQILDSGGDYALVFSPCLELVDVGRQQGHDVGSAVAYQHRVVHPL